MQVSLPLHVLVHEVLEHHAVETVHLVCLFRTADSHLLELFAPNGVEELLLLDIDLDLLLGMLFWRDPRSRCPSKGPSTRARHVKRAFEDISRLFHVTQITLELCWKELFVVLEVLA